MKVLQLHNHHESLGGAMDVLAHEAALLGAGGHEVREYSLPPTTQLGLGPVRAGLKAVWNVEACRDVEERIRAFRPDVVHVHTPFPLLSPAVFRTAKKLGVATVTTLHSYRYSCIAATCHRDGAVCEDCVGKRLKLPGLQHRCYHDNVGASAALTLSLALHRGIGTFHQSVDRFLALTGFSRQLLIRDGIPADKVVVKPNSVPDPGVAAGGGSDPRYVAFAGRLLDIKGVETMLAAWDRAEHGDLQLRIAGDGPMRPLVEERCRRDPSVSYLGWLAEDDVFTLMRGAQAVLVPSEWYEGGAPLVLLRSLAVGTPVIASDLDNISAEMLDDDAGAAFGVGDPVALAAVLTGLVKHPEQWRRRRANARGSYERRYSPTANLGKLEAVYAGAVRSDRQSAGAGS
ncbi:MAG: glycosyltransferase family 4 protein [Sporichthyaceae bacterium]|nr:glycosyltransferase family 4 protein [Sporichthyaceae bacterium]